MGVCADGGLSGFCYGRVTFDARPEPGSAIFRVSVEVVDGQFRDMLSTDIFSFRAGSPACPVRGTDRRNGTVCEADLTGTAASEEVQATADVQPGPTRAPLVRSWHGCRLQRKLRAMPAKLWEGSCKPESQCQQKFTARIMPAEEVKGRGMMYHACQACTAGQSFL